MADVRPFRGIRYNPAVVGDMANVLCPPYDIISAEQERKFHGRSPYNAIYLELTEPRGGTPGDASRYQASAARFREWQQRAVLLRDENPSAYLLEEHFAFRELDASRRALFAVVRLEPFERRIVLPHELTRPGPKADRLALMQVTHANFSPIIALYQDQEGAVAKLLDNVQHREPVLQAKAIHGGSYRLWRIAEADTLAAIGQAMSMSQLFVADGHHRYETALQYRNDQETAKGLLPPNAATNFVMMGLLSMSDPGLRVLSYHRMVGGLTGSEIAIMRHTIERAYRLTEIAVPTGPAESVAEAIQGQLARFEPQDIAAAAYGLLPGKAHLLELRVSERPKPGDPPLDRAEMRVLHHKGITPALGPQREAVALSFVHDAAMAVQSVVSGRSQVAFLLRALPLDLFVEVVGQGERLPPKSTYFYPKLPTGLVFNSLEGLL